MSNLLKNPGFTDFYHYGQKVNLWTNLGIFRLTAIVIYYSFHTIYEQLNARWYDYVVALCLVEPYYWHTQG